MSCNEKMLQNTIILLKTFFFFQILCTAKLVPSIDEIHLETNPKYMNGSIELIYYGKSHTDYLININQNITKDIRDVFVSLILF